MLMERAWGGNYVLEFGLLFLTGAGVWHYMFVIRGHAAREDARSAQWRQVLTPVLAVGGTLLTAIGLLIALVGHLRS
jgi:hypothetical protein